MAQYAINAYDADVYIPEFKGLMEYGDQMGGDLRYAADCLNVETPAGVLQPAPDMSGAVLYKNATTLATARKGTLMYLRAKVYGQPRTITEHGMPYTLNIGDEYDVYCFAAGSYIYSVEMVTDPLQLKDMTGTAKYQFTQVKSGCQSDQWSWCTYERTFSDDDPVPGPAGQTAYLLLMSNPKDGLWCFNGVTMTKLNGAPADFAWIARHGERIWGCGADDSRDTLYYSKPYNAADWSGDADDPENGGGEIRLPTWDKDKFVALKSFGDALIAFTEKRAYRITGTDPSNFTIQEQLGNGIKYPDTLVEMDNKLLFLGDHGLMSYDGYQVTPFMPETTWELLRNVAWEQTEPKATRIGNKYVLALSNELPSRSYTYEVTPTGLTPNPPLAPRYGYSLIVYDALDNTVLRMSSPRVLSFCAGTPYMWTHLVTNGDEADHNEFVGLAFDSWAEQRVSTGASRWVSPWVTLGRKDIQKSGFEVYFTPELAPKKNRVQQWWPGPNQDSKDIPSVFEEEEASGPVTFKFSIQTEKKTKTKTYTVQPLTTAEQTAGKLYKQKRLHFGGQGRKFRLVIEVEEGNTIPWRLTGGIHIIAEIDKD